jgi:hypothetical protein
MKITKTFKRTTTTLGAGLFASAVLATGFAAPASAHAGHGAEDGSYHAVLKPLNGSGVDGHAWIKLEGDTMTVRMEADGAVAYKVHPQHIHGSLDGTNASCPAKSSDINKDKFISLVEGAPAYGPVKINLTKPQTPFGSNDTKLFGASIFAPFAGMADVAGFPKADGTGDVKFKHTYMFDRSDPAAIEAFDATTPLTMQHIVIHGGYAPESVDTEGGSSKKVYDALLPVACGQIMMDGTHEPKQMDKKSDVMPMDHQKQAHGHAN